MRTTTFFSLISASQKIDKSQLTEAVAETVRALNSIPTPAVEDKPGTENYANYVHSVMVTNFNLFQVITALAKEDKNVAVEFTNGITIKEIKIIADFVVSMESLRAEIKEPLINP